MAELDDVRQRLLAKLGIGERQLLRLIRRRESETLLPRRLAILSLAADNGVAIRRHATDEDLSQLRAVKSGSAAQSAPIAATPSAERPISTTSTRDGGRKAAKKSPGVVRPRAATRGRKVFVVHGRNAEMRKALFAFLRSMNLEPIEWVKAIEATGKASPMVAEILDAAFNQAVAVVVLLTPDDNVILRTEFHKTTDPDYEKRLTGQARPNVLFEAGMAFGRNPDSTVLVQVGDVKSFSDVGGRHVARLNNSPESRSELVTKLRNAGCAVDDTGTDWYTEGDFTI